MFKAVDETIKSFLKDLNISLSLTEDTTSLYEELGRGVEMYCDNFLVDDMFIRISQKISPKNFREFKEKVESVIMPALTNLLQTFRGPSKIIRKRHDKLLDYDNVNARLKSLSDINSSIDNALKEELRVAKATYEALNLQMLDELPKLTSLARHVLHVCIIYYLQCKQILLNQTIKEIKQLVVFKGNSTAPVSSADTTLKPGEHFNIEHALAVDKLSHFSFIPSCFNPSLSTVRKGKDRDLDLCTISPSSSNFIGFDGADRVYAVAEPYLLLDLEIDSKSNEKSIVSGVEGHQLVLDKYSTDQVYRVKENFKGSLTMDINLMEDAIVGVIKRADPMGNKERWFVDDGKFLVRLRKVCLVIDVIHPKMLQVERCKRFFCCCRQFFPGSLIFWIENKLGQNEDSSHLCEDSSLENRKGFILKSYLAPYQDDFRKSFPTLHRLEQLDREKNKKLHPQDFQKQQKVWQAERRSLNLSSPPSMDDLNESFHSAIILPTFSHVNRPDSANQTASSVFRLSYCYILTTSSQFANINLVFTAHASWTTSTI
ncbi:hypothetical protein HELRODRAFT_192610 [Helobdella robusta]|uniref:BAR domain-containing protein n=1 Tax=Helobdella robusta TaxID=6412 RepID=T1FU46_HELRO|nr:hypothetical protein HELRODRAFT_192610 [Helobdella robusta]ESO00404.1 hypothetical protein HELRODRAFT_192610 [Helobdella robusta]